MNPPRALLLDLDGTILDHASASRGAVLGALLATDAVGAVDPERAVAIWHEVGDAAYQRYLGGEISFAEQRVARSRALLEAHGMRGLTPERLQAWFDGYRSRYEEAWRAFDDVAPLLAAVRSREDPPALGVVTNGEAVRQAAKLAALGLSGLPMFASSAVGAAKPDRTIFLTACKAIGVAPGEAWFVGDNREEDALGAQGAGLFGIWLDRASGGSSDAGASGRHGMSDGIEQDRPVRVTSLEDVVTLLEECGRERHE